jgi:hypothetical protein
MAQRTLIQPDEAQEIRRDADGEILLLARYGGWAWVVRRGYVPFQMGYSEFSALPLLPAPAKQLETAAPALAEALRDLLREHDTLSAIKHNGADRWPTTAKKAREALRLAGVEPAKV